MIEPIGFDLEGIPALSIRQPWPWAIFHVGKDIENRSWPTRYRGRVLIHAGKQYDSGKDDALLDIQTWARRAGMTIPHSLDVAPVGGIVGEAEIVDCVSDSESPWFIGRYGFVLRNVRQLPFRSCKGKLGFFTPQFEAAA